MKIADRKLQIFLAVGLIVLAIVSRIAPHPANFAPVTAIALFSGAVLPRKWAVILPLSAMVLSDIFLGMHSLVLFTWGSFAIVALASSLFLKEINITSVGVASLSSSVFFFIVTNFGVWLEGRLYAPTFEGLVSSYYNALPFFQNTLLGDIFYSTVIFGAYVFFSARWQTVATKSYCLPGNKCILVK